MLHAIKQELAQTAKKIKESKHGLNVILGCLSFPQDFIVFDEAIADKDFDIECKYEPLQLTLMGILSEVNVSPWPLFAIFPKINKVKLAASFFFLSPAARSCIY